MIDCMKKYKMVLSSLDGEIVYKSDNVLIDRAQIYNIERDGQMTAEIAMTAWGMKVEEAGTPPEMPTAAVAKKATKIIQEEKRDKEIAEEWEKLTRDICEAVKRGEEEITVKKIYLVNKERLMKMGYEVNRDSCNYIFRIRWVEPDFYV